MLVIRLSRTGRRNQPKYRLVVAEHTAPIKGKVVEILGHYEPIASDKKFVFDKEKLDMYMKNGAKPSNTVAKLLNANGYDLPVHVRPERKPRKAEETKKEEVPKAETEKDEETPAEAETTETPAIADKVDEEVDKPAETTEETPVGEKSAEETKEETPVEAKKEEKAPDDNQDSQTGGDEEPSVSVSDEATPDKQEQTSFIHIS